MAGEKLGGGADPPPQLLAQMCHHGLSKVSS
jgi:hypothetical protein